MELTKHLDALEAKAAELRRRADVMDAEAAELRKLHASKPEPQALTGPAAKDVRAWAANNDVEVNAKGPIPDDVVKQYMTAQEEG